MIRWSVSVAIMFTAVQASALAVDVGIGYSLLDIKNPNGSTARSTGPGGQIAGYYSLLGGAKYDFGLKGSVFYSVLKNDTNTDALQEETKHLNAGAGVELSVHGFFLSWQYKYNQFKIDLSGLLSSSRSYSDNLPQWEIGYELPMDSMAVRFVYQRTDGRLSQGDTGLSADTSVTASAFMVVLRFHWRASRSSHAEYGTYTPSERERESDASATPSYRSYRYAPRPSTRLK